MNRALTVGLIGIICLCLGGVLASPVSAGDRTGTADLIIDHKEVNSGDSVIVTLSFFSDGGYGGEGIVEIQGAIEYDEELLRVEEVTAGSFFDDDGAETNATVSDENGTVQFELNRIPSDEGTVGQGVLVSLTLAVGEDAGPANADVSVSSLSAELIDDIPLNTYTLNANQQLAIDGGVESADDDDDSDPDGVTLADDPPEENPRTDGADADSEETDDTDADTERSDDTNSEDTGAGDSEGVLAAVPVVAVVAVLVMLTVVGVVGWRRFVGSH